MMSISWDDPILNQLWPDVAQMTMGTTNRRLFETTIWAKTMSPVSIGHRVTSGPSSVPGCFFLPMRETQNFGFSRNDFFNFCVGQQNSTQSSGTTFPILWCCFGLEMKKTASLQSSFYVLLFTAFADKQVAKSVLSAVLHNIFIVSVFG